MSVENEGKTRYGFPNRAERGEMVWKGHGGRRPRVLAHGGSGRKRLALGKEHVYWADEEDGSITRLPKDGGVPLVLAADQHRATALTLHEGFLYWAVIDRVDRARMEDIPRSRIVRMPEDGGEIETLADAVLPQSIAVSGRDVYWTDFIDGISGTVMRGSLDGAPAVLLASKQKQPDSIVVDEQDVFWTNTGNKRPTYFMDGSVMRMPRAGGKKRWILAKDKSMPSSVVLDGGDVYWVTASRREPPYEAGAVVKRSRTGGKTELLACRSGEGGFLAVDATHVYCLAAYEGTMFRVPKHGGQAEQLLSSLEAALMPTFVDGLALDDQFLYWTATFSREAGGAVWKMAK